MAELDDDVTARSNLWRCDVDDDVTAGNSTTVLSNVCVDGVAEMGNAGTRDFVLWLDEWSVSAVGVCWDTGVAALESDTAARITDDLYAAALCSERV